MQGDIAFDAGGYRLFVNIFATPQNATHAAANLQAKSDVQQAVATGHSVIRTLGPVLFLGAGGNRQVSMEAFQRAVQAVEPAALPVQAQGSEPSNKEERPSAAPQADVLEQLRKLGELRDSGVISPEEFEAKKAELLKRV
jgi:Short C-terminal domain